MSQWDLNNADSTQDIETDRTDQGNDLETTRSKSHWEKRMEAARLQRARVLSGEMPATPRRVPPARELAKDIKTQKKATSETRPPNSLATPSRRDLRGIFVERIARWIETVNETTIALRPSMSRAYDLVASQWAHVSTWRMPDQIKHNKTAAIVIACGCSLALGYAIGNRTSGASPSQALTVDSVTERPLSASEEGRGPIIVGRLVELQPDLMTLQPVSQEPVSQEPTARVPVSRDEDRMPVAQVAVKTEGLLDAEPVAPVMPDILSELSNIAWTSKIIVQPESVPDVRSAVVSLPPAAPDVPPGGGSDETVRLAGLPAQVGSLRMLVFAPESVRPSVLEENLDRLTGTGAEISGLQRVDMRITTAHIRYFYEEDAQAAMVLGDTLGIEARNFLHMSGSEPGQVEVWLRGASLPAQADPDPEPDGPQSFRDRFSGEYR
jgi:hypothetical protein